MRKQMSRMKIWQLMLALALILGGGVLFIGAVSGWFNNAKTILDAEYYCENDCDGEYMELSGEEYSKLIERKKSFVVFVDQDGCKTADRLREYVKKYALNGGLKVYRMMFSTARETSLHDFVKYYPSVAVISKGKIVGFLRADNDEDADEYNDEKAFDDWMRKFL